MHQLRFGCLLAPLIRPGLFHHVERMRHSVRQDVAITQVRFELTISEGSNYLEEGVVGDRRTAAFWLHAGMLGKAIEWGVRLLKRQTLDGDGFVAFLSQIHRGV